MTLSFIRDLKERFDRLLLPPPDTKFSHRNSDERERISLRGEASLEYERYHWGSGAGPLY